MESAAIRLSLAMSATVLLTRADVFRLLPLSDCIAAVEAAFLAHARGQTFPSVVAGVRVPDGGFHIKAAGLAGERQYFAAKVNGNFPDNPVRLRLPTIQGLVVLADAGQGRLLAVMDSGSITALRTAAATGVAARHLARTDAAVATIVGCGVQGRFQLQALALVRPLTRAFAYDIVTGQAEAFATEMTRQLGVPVSATSDLRAALRQSPLVVTCTPATRPVVYPGDVLAGSFVAAVGADSEHKIEIDPALLAASKVVPDLTEQAAKIGDLHHALAAGAMRLDQVHGDLGQVIAGQRPGRTRNDEVFVFDSTGTALQDVAAAALAFERASAVSLGGTFTFDQ